MYTEKHLIFQVLVKATP